MESATFNVVLIETWNTCNRKCWFCKYGQERHDEKYVKMNWNMINKIVDNLRDLNYGGRLSWFFINEPLLDDRIYEIIELSRKNLPHAFLSLNTNGDLLTEETFGRLCTAGIDALGVSIYDDVTEKKIRTFKENGKLIMLDYRNPRPGLIDNRGGNIKKILFEKPFEINKHSNKNCMRPFNTMVINSIAQVVLCCSDMYGDVILGDVHKERLEAIWNGEQITHYRETLRKSGRAQLPLCQNCSHDGAPNPIYYPLKLKVKDEGKNLRRRNFSFLKMGF